MSKNSITELSISWGKSEVRGKINSFIMVAGNIGRPLSTTERTARKNPPSYKD